MVGLTVRPGEVLRQHLSGAQAGLIGPERYLLAAAVVDYGANRLWGWIGTTKPLVRSDSSSSGTGERLE
ncbi:hypothetical protein [Salinibacter altiplanensis]|uniref:hypothetical protein n=1 Tax=Salinibacter altiplanensis TaxID=1803181 RepID=UPI000C9ECBB7|nr:hypothetical protein [Salinibacter altiplanensis]